jgi:hypothetical protein
MLYESAGIIRSLLIFAVLVDHDEIQLLLHGLPPRSGHIARELRRKHEVEDFALRIFAFMGCESRLGSAGLGAAGGAAEGAGGMSRKAIGK